MFIYLIRRTDRHDYDEYDAFVVAAHNPQEARRLLEKGPINPFGEDTEFVDFVSNGATGEWGEPKEIGLYKQTGVEPHVILGSFNAG